MKVAKSRVFNEKCKDCQTNKRNTKIEVEKQRILVKIKENNKKKILYPRAILMKEWSKLITKSIYKM